MRCCGNNSKEQNLVEIFSARPGDALDVDISSTYVLTGSCRMDRQIQLGDVGTGKVLCTVDMHGNKSDPQEHASAMPPTSAKGQEACFPYGAMFANEGRGIACCGAGVNFGAENDLVCFNIDEEDARTVELDILGAQRRLNTALHSLDIHGNNVAIACQDGSVRVFYCRW